MKKYFSTREVPTNAWLGVTVESSAVKYRIDSLRHLPATVRFLSCEPLIDAVGEMDLTNIDWVIVGGESGPKARPMKEEWALQIQTQCEKQGSTFFFKQWGTWGSDGVKRNKHENGKLLNGKVWQAMPA
jgi:protein gp37